MLCFYNLTNGLWHSMHYGVIDACRRLLSAKEVPLVSLASSKATTLQSQQGQSDACPLQVIRDSILQTSQICQTVFFINAYL